MKDFRSFGSDKPSTKTSSLSPISSFTYYLRHSLVGKVCGQSSLLAEWVNGASWWDERSSNKACGDVGGNHVKILLLVETTSSWARSVLGNVVGAVATLFHPTNGSQPNTRFLIFLFCVLMRHALFPEWDPPQTPRRDSLSSHASRRYHVSVPAP